MEGAENRADLTFKVIIDMVDGNGGFHSSIHTRESAPSVFPTRDWRWKGKLSLSEQMQIAGCSRMWDLFVA